MLLMIDNYDSFTYNLVQYLGELGGDVVVRRNDRVTLEEAEALDPAGVIISPGPGVPGDAGVSKDIIRRFAGKRPILGVCLGHQCLGEVFGARVVRAPRLMHGKTSDVYHDGQGVYRELASPLTATRYHSLIVDPETVPPSLQVSARTPEGEIMGLRHREHPLEGVQFHPESILTGEGKRILGNFLETVQAGRLVGEGRP